MDKKVSSGVMFLQTGKEIKDALKKVYENKNIYICRVFEMYECLSTLKQEHVCFRTLFYAPRHIKWVWCSPTLGNRS